MYIVDITRDDYDNFNDILLGKDSMDAKRKAINYISDFILANFNLYVSKDIIDQNLNMEGFSLKEFMKNHFSRNIKKELLIQYFPTSANYCLYIKRFDKNKNSFPTLYFFHKDEIRMARHINDFFINDYLIVNHNDTLNALKKRIRKYATLTKDAFFITNDFNCGILSLYDNAITIEKLLNNNYSLNQLKNNCIGGIDI